MTEFPQVKDDPLSKQRTKDVSPADRSRWLSTRRTATVVLIAGALLGGLVVTQGTSGAAVALAVDSEGTHAAAAGHEDPVVLSDLLVAAENAGLNRPDPESGQRIDGFSVEKFVQAGHTIDVAVVAPAGTGAPDFISDAEISQLVNGAESFWSSQSNNQVLSVTANAQVKRFATGLVCNAPLDIWMEAAEQFGRTDVGYYLGPESRHLLVVVPDGCGPTGIGTLGVDSAGGVSADAGGYLWVSSGPIQNLEVLVHEFGHNLGLQHSNVHFCPEVGQTEGFDPVTGTFSEGCRDEEYQDFYDVMGVTLSSGGRTNLRPTALNITHKARLDAISAGEVQQLALESGQASSVTSGITLQSTGASSGKRALRITSPRTGQSYFVDYRGGTGQDSQALYADGTLNSLGVNVGVRMLTTRSDGSSVLLLAPGSGTVDGQKRYTTTGESLSTGDGSITVTVTAIAGGTATLTVRLETIFRQAGADRFAASASISAANFAPGVNTAYVTNGLNFPDALSGAPVAAMEGAPILLVTPDRIPDSIQSELRRLKPGRIVVLGGPASVSDSVRGDLLSFTAGSVSRLAGPDRFSASAAISADNFAPGVGTAYVTNGFNFPDALAGAPVAAKDSAPILLVTPTGIPASIDAELRRLRPSRIVVLGGVDSVSSEVERQMRGITGNVSRLSGGDRFSAAADISARSFAANADTVYIASGLNFPDALSGAPVAGRDSAPILLVSPTAIPPSVEAELRRLNPLRIVILGGPKSLSVEVAQDLTDFIR